MQVIVLLKAEENARKIHWAKENVFRGAILPFIGTGWVRSDPKLNLSDIKLFSWKEVFLKRNGSRQKLSLNLSEIYYKTNFELIDVTKKRWHSPWENRPYPKVTFMGKVTDFFWGTVFQKIAPGFQKLTWILRSSCLISFRAWKIVL